MFGVEVIVFGSSVGIMFEKGWMDLIVVLGCLLEVECEWFCVLLIGVELFGE